MDIKGVAELDGQIRQLEKELSALYQQRVELLEAELRRSRGLMGTFVGSSTPPLPSAPETPALRAPATKRPKKKTAKAKTSRTRKISRAAKETATLVPEAPVANVESAPVETKVSPAPAATSPAPAKKKVVARKAKEAKEPKKRTRTPTAVVEKRILDALKEAGSAGLSQIEVSKKAGLGYQTVVKKLKELPQIEKKGSLKDGRFYLKG